MTDIPLRLWAATTSFVAVADNATVSEANRFVVRARPTFVVVGDRRARIAPTFVIPRVDFEAAVTGLTGRRPTTQVTMARLLEDLGIDPSPVIEVAGEHDGRLLVSGRLLGDIGALGGVVAYAGQIASIIFTKPERTEPGPAIGQQSDHLELRVPEVVRADGDAPGAPVVRIEAHGVTGTRYLLSPSGADVSFGHDLLPRVERGGDEVEVVAERPGDDSDDLEAASVTGDEGGDSGEDGNGDGPVPVTGLLVRVPAQVERDAELNIVASITRRGGATPAIPFEAAAGEKISMVVWPVEGVEMAGPDTADLLVSADGQDRGARVIVRAVGEADGAVLVQAFKGQHELGSVVARFAIVDPGTLARPSEEQSVPIQITDGAGPDSDVALHVIEMPHPLTAEPGLGFVIIERGGKPRSFGVRPLEIDPRQRLHELFDMLEASVADHTSDQVDALVRSIGVQLYEKLLPEELRDYIAGARGTITSIVVHSDEPTIPWEMCRITVTRPDGTKEEAGHLCEEFALTRWMKPRQGQQQVDTIPMTAIGYIAPNGAGLPAQVDEVTMLEGLRSPTVAVTRVQATLAAVGGLFTGRDFDVIHFTGHGRTASSGAAPTAALELAGRAVLTPPMLLGAWANFGLCRPLVVFNACRTGRADLDLGGLGGWAPYVMEAGAAAFVGSHWNVVDTSAKEFASHLYANLYAGATFSEAVRRARGAIKRAGDPTWLAYAAYGPPGLRRGPRSSLGARADRSGGAPAVGPSDELDGGR